MLCSRSAMRQVVVGATAQVPGGECMTVPTVDTRVFVAGVKNINILVADPDPLVRRGIEHLLQEDAKLHITGQVGDFASLQSALAAKAVDTVLLDCSLAQANDYEPLRVIQSKYPQCQIIVMGTLTESEPILKLLRLGASGYLPKRGKIDEFRVALRQALVGMSPLLPDVAQQLLGHVIRDGLPSEEERTPSKLSAREKEVLQCMMQGMCNKEIAVTLKVTDRTVKAHVSNILRKMHVADRTQAVLKAMRTSRHYAS